MHPAKKMNNVPTLGKAKEGVYAELIIPTFIPLRYMDLTVDLF